MELLLVEDECPNEPADPINEENIPHPLGHGIAFRALW
jgi:hypothetical protein